MLWKFFPSNLCYREKFWSESFDMIFFTFKKWYWYQEWQDDILYAHGLHFFAHDFSKCIPECYCFWKKCYTASYRSVFKHISLMRDVEVPLSIILLLCRHSDFGFCHVLDYRRKARSAKFLDNSLLKFLNSAEYGLYWEHIIYLKLRLWKNFFSLLDSCLFLVVDIISSKIILLFNSQVSNSFR